MQKFALLILLFCTKSFADYQETCDQASQPTEYKYCIVKSENSSPENLIFYFHGSGGNEHEWSKVFPRYLKYWENQNVLPPTIVTISFGPSWYLIPQVNPPSGAISMNVFAEQIMPALEQMAVGTSAKKRSLVGASMGGVNAALVFLSDLSTLPQIYNVALLSPGFVDLSPWASDEDIEAYSNKYGANPDLLKYIAQLSQSLAPTQEAWNKLSPLEQVKVPLKNPPRLFVMANIDDKNFFRGAEAFVENAKQAIPSVKWVTWPGNHLHFQEDDMSLADFLTQ